MEGSSVHRLHYWTCYMFILAWPCLLWANVIDQMTSAAQWEVCAPSWGTQTRKTGALLQRGSIKGEGKFFLLSGTERAEAVCRITCLSPERGGNEQKTSQVSHSAAAEIHPMPRSGSHSAAAQIHPIPLWDLPLNMRQLGKLRPTSWPQVCPAQECSLLVTIERPKQINLGVNPL